MLFKILTEKGEASHGGTGKWPLPTKTKPGKWYEYDGDPRVCTQGLHLVSKPMKWWKENTRLFVAEADLSLPISSDGSEKAAFKRARLLYEVTFDWPLLPMFPEVAVYLVATALRENPDDEAAKKYLSGAYLSGADLSGADLSRANLSRANLSRAYLSRANLSRANLSRAYLSGADLSRAYLSGANLSRADLSRAYLSGAYLSGADLSRADLSRADLSRANLSRANLSGADLSRANLYGAYRPTDPPIGWKVNESGLLVKDGK